jgi:hypothetical protein
VDHGYPQAGQVKFGGFAGSPRTDVGTVVVSEDGMYWRVARQLLEEARHADVAGVQDHLSREECSAIPGGSASRIAGRVCRRGSAIGAVRRFQQVHRSHDPAASTVVAGKSGAVAVGSIRQGDVIGVKEVVPKNGRCPLADLSLGAG